MTLTLRERQDDLAKLLFTFQPAEVVAILFDYFAAALETAPEDKRREFPVHFARGVRQALVRRSNGGRDGAIETTAEAEP